MVAKKNKKDKKNKPEQSPKERFIHREISWLAFNERVLEEAVDRNNPLCERAKFLAIFANNLDEFLMVRVAGIRRLINGGYSKPDQYGYYPNEIYTKIREKTLALTSRLYTIYDDTKRELSENNIHIRSFSDLTTREKKYVKQYFNSTVFPVITPMAVDQGHPFPNLPSRTLSFVLRVKRKNKEFFALLPVPAVLPRAFRLPQSSRGNQFILLDEIIREHLGSFFRGYSIVEQGMFRITRDSDLTVEEEYAADLLKAIESEVKKRPKANAVWLEIREGMSEAMLERLKTELEIDDDHLSVIDNDLDLTYLFRVASAVPRSNLHDPSFTGGKTKYKDIFTRIKKGEFLLHVPYQSFNPVVDFITKAADDPQVLAIKMTLYRTSADSSFIKALKKAASNGKQVTVLVEIKARFDEENNIIWARQLENAGVHVIYGIPGIKIHSKIAFVVRDEDEGIRRYIHLSTGNYNEKTAEIYTDMGFFTADEDMARDISDVFNVISGYSEPARWKNVISAPNDLRDYFFQLIDNEIAHQKKNGTGFIFAKVNSLQDTKIINKLYEASQKGVKVRLIVRGICCLIPGMEGLSENIEVRSIVGRFLEHTRIFMFANNGDKRIYMSSADWMTRNLDRRIELLFNIDNEDLREHLSWILETYWKDNTKSRVMNTAGKYTYFTDKNEPFNAQEFFIEHYSKPR